MYFPSVFFIHTCTTFLKLKRIFIPLVFISLYSDHCDKIRVGYPLRHLTQQQPSLSVYVLLEVMTIPGKAKQRAVVFTAVSLNQGTLHTLLLAAPFLKFPDSGKGVESFFINE